MKLLMSFQNMEPTYSHSSIQPSPAGASIHSSQQVLHGLEKIERHAETICRQAGLFQDLTALISFPKHYL